MKETIQKLESEMNEHKQRADELYAAIKALQKVCTHDWKPDGNDSHKDYERCDICTLTRSI